MQFKRNVNSSLNFGLIAKGLKEALKIEFCFETFFKSKRVKYLKIL